MAKEKKLLTNNLLPTSSLLVHVRNGLSAVDSNDRQFIAQSERTKVVDSINLDAATVAELPEENRWDYIISVNGYQHLVGLEPHSARTSEVSVVIAKKKNASAYLNNHLKPGSRVAKWYWVTSGQVKISPMDNARRRLDMNGIAFKGHIISSLP